VVEFYSALFHGDKKIVLNRSPKSCTHWDQMPNFNQHSLFKITTSIQRAHEYCKFKHFRGCNVL